MVTRSWSPKNALAESGRLLWDKMIVNHLMPPGLFWFSTPWFSGQHRAQNQTRNQAAEMKRTKEYFSKTGNFLPPSEGPSLHTLSFYCILDPLSTLPQFICKIHLFLQHFLPLFSLNLCCCILHTWFGTIVFKDYYSFLMTFLGSIASK